MFESLYQRLWLGTTFEKDGRKWVVLQVIRDRLALCAEDAEGAPEPHPVYLLTLPESVMPSGGTTPK